MRPLPDSARALTDLDPVHARDGREVVGGWSRVGSRSDQHPVFHEGDTRAPLAPGAADSDVGSQAVTFLLGEVDPGNDAEHPVDVGVVLLSQLLLVDHGDCPGYVAEAVRVADDSYPFHHRGFGLVGLALLLCCRLFGKNRRGGRACQEQEEQQDGDRCDQFACDGRLDPGHYPVEHQTRASTTCDPLASKHTKLLRLVRIS